MRFTYREPSVALDVGTMLSDLIADAIHNIKGVREVARETGLSPTIVSHWANGKVKLPWSTAMRICESVGKVEDLWTATIYDRVVAAERLGFDFHAKPQAAGGAE